MIVLHRYIADSASGISLRDTTDLSSTVTLPYDLSGAAADFIFPFAIPLVYAERAYTARAVEVYATFSAVDAATTAPEFTLYAYALADLKTTYDGLSSGDLTGTDHPWVTALRLRGSPPNGNTDANEVARTLESGGEPDSVCGHFFNKGSAATNENIGAKYVVVRIQETAGDSNAGTLDSLEVVVLG